MWMALLLSPLWAAPPIGVRHQRLFLQPDRKRPTGCRQGRKLPLRLCHQRRLLPGLQRPCRTRSPEDWILSLRLRHQWRVLLEVGCWTPRARECDRSRKNRLLSLWLRHKRQLLQPQPERPASCRQGRKLPLRLCHKWSVLCGQLRQRRHRPAQIRQLPLRHGDKRGLLPEALTKRSSVE